MKSSLCFLCLLGVLVTGVAWGHKAPINDTAGAEDVGIEEKAGQLLPQDLPFRDENGRAISLRDLSGKPVIMTIIYYTCKDVCPLMLAALAQAVPRLGMALDKDYRIVTVSFDETDTPELAREWKRNYAKATGIASAESGWKFLTGARESIDGLTKATGFSFRKEKDGFNHPVVLIFLSPEGRITKYHYVTRYGYGATSPVSFSSFDLNVALTEAAQGKAVTSLKKALLYCFSHEPPGQSRFFNFMGVVGLITLVAMASFFVYLQVTSRRYRKGTENDSGQ